nr:MAG TPA: hypothetical protein [Caudoviricetes sp.]
MNHIKTPSPPVSYIPIVDTKSFKNFRNTLKVKVYKSLNYKEYP